MKNSHTNLKRTGYLLSLLTFMASLIFLQDCSTPPTKDAKSLHARTFTPVPISTNYIPPPQIIGSMGLVDDSSQGLDLVSVATGINVSVTGCASGFTIGTTLIQSGVVNLYKLDQNCLVKLQSFIFGTTTYSATATGATNFTTWTAGSVATFANTVSATDLIKVFVESQVTAGGVTGSDTISYTFTDITAGATNNVSQASVSYPVPLTVTGRAAPAFSVWTAKFVSTNANGSVNMAFTLACTSAVTGSAGAYSCAGVPLTQFAYYFGKDNYSQGAITVAQANALTYTTVTSGIELGGGATDPNGGSAVTNGGFATGSLVTGTVAVYPSNLNNVFIIQGKDGSGNVTGYLYFYVNIASITES